MASEAAWNPSLWLSAGGDVPSHWDLVPFGDLLQSPKSIAVGVMYPGSRTDGGVPLIRVGDVGNGGVVRQPSMAISPEVHYEYRRTALSGNELLITLVGTPGVCVLARPEMEGWNVARALAVAKLKQPELRPFIKAVLESSVMRNIILGMLNTTVQPTLNLKEIKILPVPMPRDLAVALELGRVAELFNERIASLQQTNATLEAIAQALFKSWFVDFDPVRAKAEGREPEGMDAAIAALFPSEFEDSELGPIPKGWETESFDREFDFTMGQSPPGSTYNEEGAGVPFFQGSTDFGDVFPSERVFCTQPTRFARPGDLLMSVRAPVGALNIANIDCSIGRGLCAIRHKSGSTGFTQQSVQACLARIVNAAGEGALFKSLSKKQLADLPVVAADSPVVDAMISLLEPLAARRIAGARQAQRLAALRDTLLPRLISGKLRLPDAEREIEAATA